MNASSFDIETLISKLTLAKTFEFETHTPLEDCIHNLRLLQPNPDWNVHFGGPRNVHEVVISQFDEQNCYYDVSTLYRARRGRGYSRTANVNGRMQYNPETGITKITGESQLNGVSMGILLLALLIFCIFTLSFRFPLFIILFALGALGYSVYGMVQDQAQLIRVIQAL